MIDFVLIIVVFYLFLIMHEYCHLLVYKVFQIKINSFYVFPLSFEKDKNKCFSFEFKNIVTGLVKPKICSLNNKTKKIIAFSLISAPIMHFIFMLIGLILWFVFLCDIYLYIFLINIIMLLSTLLEQNYVVGDLLAFYYIITSHKKSKKIFKGILS